MFLVVVGAQWGDEGKGKVVDALAGKADTIVRFSGGANAGHTIVIGEETYKLHLVPSGILTPKKKVILGSGMVINPEALLGELKGLEERGIVWRGRLFISDRAHLILPNYLIDDQERDKRRSRPIGTTGRGIGIAYELKAAREGIRVADLYDQYYWEGLDEEDRVFLTPFKEELASFVINIAHYMCEQAEQCSVLFEGAQGILLDPDVGTYPFVSSGCSHSAGAALGGGVGTRQLSRVLGVAKAYTTRVGNGPFPSEFQEKREPGLACRIRRLGHEYGTTTGRPRRCGYLDLVALRYACWVGSLDGLVLTHLDIYDEFEEIGICQGYRLRGKRVDYFPTAISDLMELEPIIEFYKGWNSPLAQSGIRQREDFPKEAKKILSLIEMHTKTPIVMVSLGPERHQMVSTEKGGSDYWPC